MSARWKYLIALGAVAVFVATGLRSWADAPAVQKPAAGEQYPAGWQTAFTRLRLPAGARVLVIPDLRYGLRWQAETGVPASIVGGGDFVEPGAGGQATSYVYQRLPTAEYLTDLWLGSRPSWVPSRTEIRKDLAYWQVTAIVTVASRDSRLARFLTAEFGPPAIQVGDVLAWRQPVLRASRGRLAPYGGKENTCLAWRRSSSLAEPGSLAHTFANGCWPTGAR